MSSGFRHGPSLSMRLVIVTSLILSVCIVSFLPVSFLVRQISAIARRWGAAACAYQGRSPQGGPCWTVRSDAGCQAAPRGRAEKKQPGEERGHAFQEKGRTRHGRGE